ncbi:hypothetical protein GCM10009838_45210 [Catenulispora subtropica]|uniref:Uncharacterized protein n=1 Tax=Catenulispora subtropica TaxID=450798 RepID=A0ABN2S2D0_9ACTN
MATACTLTEMPCEDAKLLAKSCRTGARWASVQITRSVLGSRTGGAVEDDDAAAGAELEAEAEGVAAPEPEEDGFEAALGLEEELEQPATGSVAATTAIAAIEREGRYLTMTPSVSGCGNDGDTPHQGFDRSLIPAPSGRDSPLTPPTITGNSRRAICCRFLLLRFRSARRCF